MLRIFKYFTKKDWLYSFICLCLVILQVWFDLKLPDYMSYITTLLQSGVSEIAPILTAGGSMLLCAIFSLIATFAVAFFAAKVAAGLSMRLREKVFAKTLSFSMEEINGFSTSSLITRSTNDITQVQTIVVMGLQIIIKAPLLAVFAIVKIAGKNMTFTLATGAAVVFLLIMLTSVTLFAIPKSRAVQGLTDNINRITRENLTGLRVVRAYNADTFMTNKFEQANDNLTNTQLFVGRFMAVMQPGMTFVSSALTLAIYWLGAILTNNAGENSLVIFSDMVVFSSYAMQVILAFMMLSFIFIILPRASVSAKRILEVLDTKTAIVDGNETKGDSSKAGELEFKNVSFCYPDASEAVLENISFVAKKGETVAFIGSTGSGKSTLVNLLPRFYDCTSGEILLDGINIKNYSQKALRNKIGYVSQKAILFAGTVMDNVLYGENGEKSTTPEQALAAIETAQAKEFVDRIGVDFKVAQGGSNLSGGQKQRLSIARAIARNPEVFIFDDSFSALDYKTDRLLRGALNEKTTNATKLIVAQRIGTIKDADRIIVLDEGKIVGNGKHRELLKTCDVYKEIALSQLSKEEIEHE